MIERFRTIFRRVFDDEQLVVEPTTTADDIESWDSLMHVTLLVHLEAEFGVRFRSAQVAELRNVGELMALVEQLQASR